MKASFTVKKLIIAAVVISLGITVFLIQALAGQSLRLVVFVKPPAFVERYVTEMNYSDPSSHLMEPQISGQVATAKFAT